VLYLTVFSVALIIRISSKKLERLWKEAFVSYWDLPMKIIKTFFEDDLALGHDLNWGSHEYETDLLSR
jgi:hypothetical protein